MQDKIQAIQNRVAECIKAAEAKFGIKMPYVQVRFDLRGKAAGMAGWISRMSGDQFYLRFNRNHIALGGQTYEHLLMDTVPHEVAHTVCQAFPKFGRNHDAGWRRVCIALGGNGKTRYSEDDAPEAIAAMRPYVYITTNGNEVRVTKVIHGKIQNQHASYVMKGGKGKINRQCQYSYISAPAVKAAAKPIVVAQPAPIVPAGTYGSSKADRVRAFLKQAKADHGSAAQEKTIAWAVANLHMTPTLARTYVKNNWSKA